MRGRASLTRATALGHLMVPGSDMSKCSHLNLNTAGGACVALNRRLSSPPHERAQHRSAQADLPQTRAGQDGRLVQPDEGEHMPSSVQVAENPARAVRITDRDGMDEAWSSRDGIFIHRNTMYISGTRNFPDVTDDLKLPAQWLGLNPGTVRTTQRYRDARAALDNTPNIKRVVGHSLGGVVAETLGQENNIRSESYGSPTPTWRADDNPMHTSDRNWWDPISMLNRGARRHSGFANPHTYRNIEIPMDPDDDIGGNF